jgi:predicted phosphodiesterase
MRILAISDIHNNVACVRKLRSQEDNRFDTIAIAGDIGSYRAQEIFDVLKTFQCPIVYVYGNWDSRLNYDDNFGPDCHLIHLNVVKIGSLAFTGFSDFRPGRDPLIGHIPRGVTGTSFIQRYRDALVDAITNSGVDLRKTIVMTHERTTRLGARLPGVLLYMFGHIHVFGVSDSKGSKYINVSALDRILSVKPVRAKRRSPLKGLTSEEFKWAPHIGSDRHVNAGNYTVLEIASSGEVRAECRLLQHAYEGWTVIGKSGWFGAPLVPDEAIFGDNIRFPEETI